MNKKRTYLFISAFLLSFALAAQHAGYTCPPCGCSNDGKIFENPGNCGSCSMKLLNTEDKSEGLNYTNLDLSEVCNKVIENPSILFLDVRTEREFKSSPLGRIKGAKHIHISDLQNRVGELSDYKDKEIIVYCLVGIRSARGSDFLAENGFSKVNNMLGGMELWNQSSEETVKCRNTLLEK